MGKTELVPVYFEDRVSLDKRIIGVKSLIQANFPPLTDVSLSTYKDIHDFKPANGLGCGLSIKVPSKVHEAGKALHLTSKYYNPKYGHNGIVVYPKIASKGTKYGGEKEGRGHFTSKSINRDAYWKPNLMIEATTGMGICQTLYESGRFLPDQAKQDVYTIYAKRNDLKHLEIKKFRSCKEITRETAKQKCQDELKDLQNQIDTLTDLINEKYQ